MTSSREDYILAIYRLTRQKGFTNAVTIAKMLNVSRASVSEMLNKLLEEELIIKDKNKICLSEKGLEAAKDIVSTHRLWEYFLVHHLKMSPKEAHLASDLLEHATSDTLKDALNEYLGYPKFSTSGNLIYQNEKKDRS